MSTRAPISPPAGFRSAYAEQRAAEGRGRGRHEADVLPYLRRGPLARQWRVRARSYEAFLRHVLRPLARESGTPLRLLDLGAGNGWLARRAALDGHDAVPLDLRDDAVDGLGAAPRTGSARGGVRPIVASFEALPLRPWSFDLAVFNASLHYALDLPRALAEAVRAVRPGGRVVILDSPFYRDEEAGRRMVAEKRADAAGRFGARAGALLTLPFIEFLTARTLEQASAPLGLRWRRRRVRYPLWYEARPLVARLRRRRAPSRFDLWEATVP